MAAERSGTFWLDELPLEILPQIALHLDPWSLRALLKTSQNLLRHTVLLVGGSRTGEDNRFRCFVPQFFRNRMRWTYRVEFNPLVTRDVVLKIFELSTLELVPRKRIEGIPGFHHITPRDSYVLFLGDGHPFDVHYFKWASRLMGPLKLPWWRDYLSVSEGDLWKRIGNRFPRPETITQIELSSVSRIHNIVLPSLCLLRVVFTDPIDGTRPCFSKITAPKLRHISLSYGNTAPLIEDVELASEVSTLRLCHVPSLRGDLSRPLPLYPSSIEELDFSALCAGGRSFVYINVIGGHDQILRQLDMRRTEKLFWRQTCEQTAPVLALPRMPDLGNLVFESFLPDALAPSPHGVGSKYLDVYCVVGHDGLRLNEPVFNRTELKMNHLLVHCKGDRDDRAIPSLSSLCPLLLKRGVSFTELSLHGLSVPPAGEYGSVEQILFGRSYGWKTLACKPDIEGLIQLPR